MPFQITTERLLVRPWRDTEHAVFAGFVADEAMMRYITHGRVWDAARVRAYFTRQAGFLDAHGCCVGAVVLKPGQEVIGMGGLQPLDKLGEFELAWWIWKRYWGQGLAPEMARAFVTHAFRVMHLPRVVAVIDAANRASIRVAEKLGMQCLGERDAHDLDRRHEHEPVMLYALERSAA
ncbi:MAG TPA: GNAT family N-acetyltransferase [Gammaproteobacteria bacterium]|nr:GNAT family N-acetyltransferase [Gammaproteobacteria bacterium]